MLINAASAERFLRSGGHIAPNDNVTARELSGGVSNVVVYISRTNGDDFVLKQVREQLNVVEPWFCSVERIWREVEVLCVCQRLTETADAQSPLRIETPRLLFEDRENFLYAMSAAPRGHVVWKSELMAGLARADVAASCGALLGRLHAGSWHDPKLALSLEDRQFFEDLRLDPYYRHVARVHPDLRAAIERLIDSVWSERHCLVHGDFSPKNLLVGDDCLMLIDFEVGHYGDPAFDLGFFLSHLVLKAFYHAPAARPYFELIDSFWMSYRAEMMTTASATELDALVQRGILNLGACAMARLDGKSQIDYLRDGARRDQVRRLCRAIFSEPPACWADVAEVAHRCLSPETITVRSAARRSG